MQRILLPVATLIGPSLAGACASVIVTLAVIVPSLLAFSATAHAALAAAEVRVLEGQATARGADGRVRSLEEGDPVFVGDRLRTGRDSRLSIEFRDRTRFDLDEHASMEVEKFSYAGETQAQAQAEPEPDTFAAKVLQGTFRFLTGLLAKAKPEAMEVATPVATIGIRGTNVAGLVEGTSATIVLLEPEEEEVAAERPPAIEVANEFGRVRIDRPGYGTEIPDEHSPPSTPRPMRLHGVTRLLRSIHTTRRLVVPRTQRLP